MAAAIMLLTILQSSVCLGFAAIKFYRKLYQHPEPFTWAATLLNFTSPTGKTLTQSQPYLLSLGFSESTCALVWSISPLCGTFIQPLFGDWSDRYRHAKWDRRRPFMLGGGIAISVALIGLSTSGTIVQGTLNMLNIQFLLAQASMLKKTAAVFWFLAVNLGIQPLQVCGRAYVVENCGIGNQIIANAWASRVQGVCGILGFVLASLPLTKISPLGASMSEFTILVLWSDFLMLLLVGIACYRRPTQSIKQGSGEIESPSTIQNAREGKLFRSIRDLPLAVRSVYLVQWFAWMGWFPFLAYYTSYVNALSPLHEKSTQSTPGSNGPGSMGASSAYDVHHASESGESTKDPNTIDMSAGPIAGLLFSIVAFASTCVLPSFVAVLDKLVNAKHSRSRRATTELTESISHPPAITALWAASHVSYVVVVLLTFAVSSQVSGTVLIASIGVPWAAANWIPYCLLGMVLERLQQLAATDKQTAASEVGAVMGIHSAAISAPQIISALTSSLGLAMLPQGASMPGWALRMGACWTLIAAILCVTLIRRGCFTV